MLWWDNRTPMRCFAVSAAGFPALELGCTSWVPHMRVRCCVLIRISGYRFPHTSEIQIGTLCCKYPRAVRCIRTQRCWRPVDSLRHQIPHWFRFCNHSFIFSRSFLLYWPFRRGLRGAGWAEMARCKLWNGPWCWTKRWNVVTQSTFVQPRIFQRAGVLLWCWIVLQIAYRDTSCPVLRVELRRNVILQ